MEILVEDKTLPYCTGLEDLFVGCDDLPELFDPLDTLHLQALFGIPTVVDNCAAESIELEPIVDADGCGAGTITRRWLAVDRVGNISAYTFIVRTVIGLNTEPVC